jgi:hypothetical protein
MHRKIFVAVILAMAIVAGCHPQASTPGIASHSRNVIMQDEIDSTRSSNVYDLIARTRGDFLKDRGAISIKTKQRSVAVVFMNDQEYGIIETLRNVLTSHIGEVRYYSGTDAVAKFGAQYGGGVIQLISRSQ